MTPRPLNRDPLHVGYPTIPQLWGSTGTYDDTFMCYEESLSALRRCTVTIEKRDGWNIGFDGSAKQPLLKGRASSWSAVAGPVERIEQLRSWRHRATLDEDHVVFGEWCPDAAGPSLPWYVFDIYQRSAACYLSWELVRSQAQELGVLTPPVLRRGAIDDFELLHSLVGWSDSSNAPMEGIVLRVEEGEQLRERYKYVRPGFMKREA